MTTVDTTVTIPADIVKDIQRVKNRLRFRIQRLATPETPAQDMLELTDTYFDKLLNHIAVDGSVRQDVHDVVALCEFMSLNAPAFDGPECNISRPQYLRCRSQLELLAVPAFIKLHPEAVTILDGTTGEPVSEQDKLAALARLDDVVAKGEFLASAVHLNGVDLPHASDFPEPLSQVRS